MPNDTQTYTDEENYENDFNEMVIEFQLAIRQHKHSDLFTEDEINEAYEEAFTKEFA